MVRCTVSKQRSLSMKLPDHRIAACLGKAAMKTHALQTLTRPPLSRWRARSVWSASGLSALSVWRGTASGSWPQRTIPKSSRLSMKLLLGVPASAGPQRLKAEHRTDGATQKVCCQRGKPLRDLRRRGTRQWSFLFPHASCRC